MHAEDVLSGAVREPGAADGAFAFARVRLPGRGTRTRPFPCRRSLTILAMSLGGCPR